MEKSEKYILVTVDKIPKFKIAIKKEDKIRDIKKSFNEYKDYSIEMFLNKKSQLKVFETDKYDDMSLETVWNQIKNPSIILIKNISFPKDVFLHITNLADDRTVLNMLATNKKYNNPEFFKRILEPRYPMLIRFKKEEESWKSFYIKMIYYIAKLKEDLEFDYIPAPSFNPEKLYREAVFNPLFLENKRLEFLAEIGGKELLSEIKINTFRVKDFLSKMMEHAAEGGNISLLKMLVEEYGYMKPSAIYGAIKSKNNEIIDYVKNYPWRHYDLSSFNLNANRGAAEIGDLKYLDRLKLSDLYDNVENIIIGDHLEIVKKIINHPDHTLDIKSKKFYFPFMISTAVKNNNLKIVKYLVPIYKKLNDKGRLKELKKSLKDVFKKILVDNNIKKYIEKNL